MFREWTVNLALVALLLAVPFAANAMGEPFIVTLATKVAIFALAGVGLNIALGYGGLVSFGHAAFFGIGAYTAGILSARGWGEPISGLLLAAAVTAAVGYIVSFMIVRVQHLALLMITLLSLVQCSGGTQLLMSVTGVFAA